jgi:hypothetical protein
MDPSDFKIKTLINLPKQPTLPSTDEVMLHFLRSLYCHETPIAVTLSYTPVFTVVYQKENFKPETHKCLNVRPYRGTVVSYSTILKEKFNTENPCNCISYIIFSSSIDGTRLIPGLLRGCLDTTRYVTVYLK